LWNLYFGDALLAGRDVSLLAVEANFDGKDAGPLHQPVAGLQSGTRQLDVGDNALPQCSRGQELLVNAARNFLEECHWS
jgi:hypothetical protein